MIDLITVSHIIGAVEIFNLWVSLIEMKMKTTVTVSADQKAGEHIVLTFNDVALADFTLLLLHLIIS